MEYQQLPPVSMIIGTPNSSQTSHLHNLNSNNNNNNNSGTNNQQQQQQQLLTMQPPLLPLQVTHNLHQLTSLSNQNNAHGLGNATQNQNAQSLPPTAQLLQAIHNNTQHQTNIQNMGNNANGTNQNNSSNADSNTSNDENSRWTQYQVQQLWRQHHAYLNGKVILEQKVSPRCIYIKLLII